LRVSGFCYPLDFFCRRFSLTALDWTERLRKKQECGCYRKNVFRAKASVVRVRRRFRFAFIVAGLVRDRVGVGVRHRGGSVCLRVPLPPGVVAAVVPAIVVGTIPGRPSASPTVAPRAVPRPAAVSAIPLLRAAAAAAAATIRRVPVQLVLIPCRLLQLLDLL